MPGEAAEGGEESLNGEGDGDDEGGAGKNEGVERKRKRKNKVGEEGRSKRIAGNIRGRPGPSASDERR